MRFEAAGEFPDDFRCEIIGGVFCDMGASRRYPQALVTARSRVFGNYFLGHPCKTYLFPGLAVELEPFFAVE